LADEAEITLEANPTSVEAGNFRGYAAAGVNRVSMGVQALDDADLKALGRMHSVAEAERAFEIARSVFDRVSFDLIYARTGQTTAAWEAELIRALTMAVDHLSLYQLTIEQGTRFAELHARGRLSVPGDDVTAEMYAVTQDVTAAAGLPAYEVSNHARPGAESRHNLIYWRYGDYAGIGPGAHGRITGARGRRALATVRDPAAWMGGVARDGHAIAEAEHLAPEDQAREYLMMSMRLAEGTDRARFEALGGRLDAARLADLASMGLIEDAGGRVRATGQGRIVLNTLIAELLD
jgi:oxygen-independent coproporphyrinogen-3 oxidase